MTKTRLACAALAVVMIVFLATAFAVRDQKALPRGRATTLLGQRGEWVTRPDGRRVCRLSADLMRSQPIGPSFCTDWQEPEPAVGDPVEGWMRASRGGYQIMIEGSWRP